MLILDLLQCEYKRVDRVSSRAVCVRVLALHQSPRVMRYETNIKRMGVKISTETQTTMEMMPNFFARLVNAAALSGSSSRSACRGYKQERFLEFNVKAARGIRSF